MYALLHPIRNRPIAIAVMFLTRKVFRRGNVKPIWAVISQDLPATGLQYTG